MRNIITNNTGLKLLSLFLAVLTWFYIVVELQKGTTTEIDTLERLLPYKIVSKQVPIKLSIAGEPQSGYYVSFDDIIVTPSTCVMLGPRSVLDRVSSVNTQKIDVEGYSRSITKDVSVIMPIKGVGIREKFVTVTIPILKKE